MNWRLLGFSVASIISWQIVHAADGDLDPTFGTGGKVQLAATAGRSSPSANDVAVQADGKVVLVGYETSSNASGSFEEWRLDRLNVDGSEDGSFGGPIYVNGGPTPTRAQAVAVRADGRIVVAGVLSQSDGIHAEVAQYLSNGTLDPSFSIVSFLPTNSGDNYYISRVVIDTDGSIDVVGTYYVSSANNYQFFFDRIAPDGSSNQPFGFEFGSGTNQDAHAMDMAIDSQGRYVVVGYAPGTNGYDCAVIRISRDLYDVDRTFNYQDPDNYGYQTVAFDLGGDDNDVCNAVALFSGSGNIVIGGHATATASNGTYQAAVLAELNSDGTPDSYFSSGLLYPTKFSFTYSLNPTAAQTNDITRLIVDNYDTKAPQLLVAGTGNQYAVPGGIYFGIARINPPSIYSNFSRDSELNGKGVEGVYFAERPTGFGNFITDNYGLSAAYAADKFVVAGYTQAPSGTQIAVTRLAAFDGVFKNGFDTPSY